MGRTSCERFDYASLHHHRMGGSRPSLAPQLSLDLCLACFELEPESLFIAFAGARLQRLHRSGHRWRGAGVDGVCGWNTVQCRCCCFCGWHCETARSHRRSVTETRVLIPTIEANDKLDDSNYPAHHGTCEARAPTCA